MINDWPGVNANPVPTVKFCVPPLILRYDSDVVAYLSPDAPLLPEDPLVPAVPEEPAPPDVPLVPDEPATPEVPEDPDDPLVPEEPELPDVPLVPEAPTPDVPEEPELPDVPDDIVFPLTINVPATLRFPAKSVSPE